MDNDAIHDLFAGLGRISIRRMFGGKGIYFEGVIIALELSTGSILVKADETSIPEFEAAGCEQWTYEGKSKLVKMPYWTVPDEAYDDPEIMTEWARRAYQAALRVAK
jgi:DNA transformation protein and related proteins